MMDRADLILRRATLPNGQCQDVAMKSGTISAIGPKLDIKGPDFDCGGLPLIPGLIDHHIHLFATAAKRESVDLEGVTDVAKNLRAAAAKLPPGTWIRGIGLDTEIDRATLDQWLPGHPVRIQHRTGALWMLNSRAWACLGEGPFPSGVDPDRGHVWRQDDWLRDRLGSQPPSLAALGHELARLGVTGVTDAGANNGPAEASLLVDAGLPQKVMLMGLESLPASPDYILGPVKLLYDESASPDPEVIARRIIAARALGRSVVAHVVTVGELVIYLAALDLAGGATPGDRIEHGSLIPGSYLPEIAAKGLTVVTQPGFVATRGDRYLAQIDADELPDLYRLASLLDAGIAVGAGSDAPYGSLNPWQAIRAATGRTTKGGRVIGKAEAIPSDRALSLYLGSFENPGGPTRQIEIGQPADLSLLGGRLQDVIAADGEQGVALTLIKGAIAYP
jgi:predicted amidohydrolase YtcJ